MKTIRRGVFETNSSSTHSICICTKEEYKQWRENEIFYHIYDQKFYTKEEVIEQLSNLEEYRLLSEEEIFQDFIENIKEFDYQTLDSWGDGYESDYTSYTTKGGEELVILCYYGNDY